MFEYFYYKIKLEVKLKNFDPMQFWTQNQFQNIFQREINQVKIYLKSIMKSKSILQCETKHAI